MKHIKHNNEPDSLEAFLASDTEAQELWSLAGQMPRVPALSKADADRDLDDLFARLGIETESKKSSNTFRLSWLIAATVLLIAGAGYLFTPTEVHVPYGETITHSFPDGSTVELNSGSTIHYSKLFGKTHRELSLHGEGYFTVAKQDQPFKIKTGDVTTEVLGTVFNLRSWHREFQDVESLRDENRNGGAQAAESQRGKSQGDASLRGVSQADESQRDASQRNVATQRADGTEITVVSGTVLLTSEEQSLKLQGGEAGHWSPAEASFTGPIKGNFDHALAWRDSGISFYEQSLPSILKTLERRFDVHISWTQSAAGQFGGSVTAYYSAPLELERILTDITTIKSLHYVSVPEGYRIFPRTDASSPSNPALRK